MSLGFGAKCKMIDKDDECYIYSYTSYNLNLPNWKSAQNTFDGLLVIDKEFFPDPEIVRKLKKKPNGRKVWIEKKKYPEIDIGKFIKEGKITIENSSHCWRITEEGYDGQALRLLYKLSTEYQETDIIPVILGIFS